MTVPRPFADQDSIRDRLPPSVVTLWLVGTVLLGAGYAIVFVLTGRVGIPLAIVDAAANVVPLSLLAAAVRALLQTEVMRHPPMVQAVCHFVLAVAFAFVWYAALVMLLAIASDVRGESFALIGFSGPALTWQVFQGVLLYALIAALCYAVRGGRAAAVVTIAPADALPLCRYLTRRGDDLTPVNAEDIVTVTGAQDYAEVATAHGRHLIRMSLTDLERRLDAVSFVRVHRSTIINLYQLERIEAAGGGRLLAYMSNGDTVPVSRTGSKALKPFIV